jgi:hypothetical protein
MYGDGRCELVMADVQGVFEDPSLVTEVSNQVMEGAQLVYKECLRPAYSQVK